MTIADDIDRGISQMIQDIIDSQRPLEPPYPNFSDAYEDEVKESERIPEKFFKYDVKYIADRSLWLALSWWHDDDPQYIKEGLHRCWNKCPIAALSQLHNSISKYNADFDTVNPEIESEISENLSAAGSL